MQRASTAPGGRRTPLWQPRQNSITSDFGRQWNKPKWASKSRPCTPTEAASRRAFGRSEEPFTYNFEKRAKQREAQRAAEARKWGFQPPAAEGFVNPLAMARKRPNPDTVWRTRKLLAQTLDKRREQRERSVATSAFRAASDGTWLDGAPDVRHDGSRRHGAYGRKRDVDAARAVGTRRPGEQRRSDAAYVADRGLRAPTNLERASQAEDLALQLRVAAADAACAL